MADTKFKKMGNFRKSSYSGVFGASYYESTVKICQFINPRWQIQYGGHKILKMESTRKTSYPTVFGVTDCESTVKIFQFINPRSAILYFKIFEF